jgi:hypothetical protein
MSEQLRTYRTTEGAVAVWLPFDLDDVVADWSELRVTMARDLHESFTRDEWAYLIQFLDSTNLMRPFLRSFGSLVDGADDIWEFVRPRGEVAVWLPNNVSLLGPLMLVMLSLTGNPVRLKAGSQATDLTGAFLGYSRDKLPDGALREYLTHQVQLEVMDRNDPRQSELAAEAIVRIVFGGDDAAQAIHALGHPVESVPLSFVDKRSEAWVEPAALDDEGLRNILRVFAIYGQAGCTSPSRVVLLGADVALACEVRDQLIALWPEVVRHKPDMHVASGNVMAWQWAAAIGWDAKLAPDNAALIAAGASHLDRFAGPMSLPVVAASAEQAREQLPPNVQTIGHVVVDSRDSRWLDLLGTTAIKRFVPVAQMHHFGPLWDGYGFWRQLFEEVEFTT